MKSKLWLFFAALALAAIIYSCQKVSDGYQSASTDWLSYSGNDPKVTNLISLIKKSGLSTSVDKKFSSGTVDWDHHIRLGILGDSLSYEMIPVIDAWGTALSYLKIGLNLSGHIESIVLNNYQQDLEVNKDLRSKMITAMDYSFLGKHGIKVPGVLSGDSLRTMSKQLIAQDQKNADPKGRTAGMCRADLYAYYQFDASCTNTSFITQYFMGAFQQVLSQHGYTSSDYDLSAPFDYVMFTYTPGLGVPTMAIFAEAWNLTEQHIDGFCDVNLTNYSIQESCPQDPTNPGGPGNPGGPITFNEVQDEFTTPCFSTTLTSISNSVLGNGMQSFASDLLGRMYGPGDQLIGRFQEANLAPTLDGTTNGSRSGAYVTVLVTLNTSGLANSSREYIGATLIHELLHGYFFLQGNDCLKDQGCVDHMVMAAYYVDKMANVLRQAYPSLSPENAEALCWGGLSESLAWKKMLLEDPAKANGIVAINNAFKAGLLGTPCN